MNYVKLALVGIVLATITTSVAYYSYSFLKKPSLSWNSEETK